MMCLQQPVQVYFFPVVKLITVLNTWRFAADKLDPADAMEVVSLH